MKVVPFVGKAASEDKAEPNPMLIQAIEELLDMAKRGEISDFIAGGINVDGKRISVVGQSPDPVRMLGAVELLKMDFIARNTE